MVTAQRLVRRLCVACRVPRRSQSPALRAAGFSEHQLDGWQPYAAAGCAACHGIGYRGRVGVHQVMPVSDAMRELIVASAGTHELARLAQTEQVGTLRDAALERVRDGTTSRRGSPRRHGGRMNTATTHRPLAADMRFKWRGVDANGVREKRRDSSRRMRPPHARCSSATTCSVSNSRRTAGTASDRHAPRTSRYSPGNSPACCAPACRSRPRWTCSRKRRLRAAGMPRIVGALARDITGGLRFSAALARHPARFNALYCQLVEVGEAAGALAGRPRAASPTTASAPPRSAPKCARALTYPVAILLLAMAITAALLVWVVPTFKTDLRRLRRQTARTDAIRAGVVVRRGAMERTAFAMIFACAVRQRRFCCDVPKPRASASRAYR